MKSSVFEKELNWIKDEKIRQFTIIALNDLPDYFYEVAASSTGKYHPDYALGEGGLVRHTKAAVTIAKDLLGLEMYSKFTSDEKDVVLASILLHDGVKHGVEGGKYSKASHPVDCAEWLNHNAFHEGLLTSELFSTLASCIASHMGQWNTDYKTNREILPKPVTPLQKFVHQCDYLASRKYLEVNFNVINYEGDRV